MALSSTSRFLAISIAVGVLAGCILVPGASGSVTYVTEWGSSGTGYGEFGGPVDLAASPSGSIFVSDTFDNRIPRVQRFTDRGAFELQWGGPGAGAGEFLAPGGVAAGPSGVVYVADQIGNRIQKFSHDGLFLGEWGTPGSAAGQFASPWGLATDDRGRVYVVDYGNNRIQKFDSDGRFLDQWGSFGSRDGQFLAPSFVATDVRGHVYVADSGNSRIQRFSSNGRFLGSWDSPGPGAGIPDYPLGVATDRRGDVFVVGTNSIRKYNRRGVLLTRWGGYGRGKGRFRNPQGITTDSFGNVYVGDSGNDRIQKFHDPGGPYPDPGAGRLSVSSRAVKRVAAGRPFRLSVRVGNTGSSPVHRARVCIRRGSRPIRMIGRPGCRRLGSIGVGRAMTSRFRIGVGCVPGRRIGIVSEATASNAMAARTRTTVRVAGCDPRRGPRPHRQRAGR